VISKIIPGVLRRRLKSLVRSPLFWAITVWGNLCIFGGAVIFYLLESDLNPTLNFLDCLVWAVGIVTTVGGGDVHPATIAGKVLSILMMMGGAVFLWSYMALFIGFLVEPELVSIQHEFSEIQSEIREDEQILAHLKKAVSALEKRN
jgi:hypothetical protein